MAKKLETGRSDGRSASGAADPGSVARVPRKRDEERERGRSRKTENPGPSEEDFARLLDPFMQSLM